MSEYEHGHWRCSREDLARFLRWSDQFIASGFLTVGACVLGRKVRIRKLRPSSRDFGVGVNSLPAEVFLLWRKKIASAAAMVLTEPETLDLSHIKPIGNHCSISMIMLWQLVYHNQDYHVVHNIWDISNFNDNSNDNSTCYQHNYDSKIGTSFFVGFRIDLNRTLWFYGCHNVHIWVEWMCHSFTKEQ